MKRTVKILGIATVLAVLLAVSIGGVVSAANGDTLQTKNQSQSGDCICDCECVCLNADDCTCLNACGENIQNQVQVKSGKASQFRVKTKTGNN